MNYLRVYCNLVRAAEQREKMVKGIREKLTGKTRVFTDEHKQNISKGCKGRIPWNKGIPRSDELKQKLSEKLKGRIISEETRKKNE